MKWRPNVTEYKLPTEARSLEPARTWYLTQANTFLSLPGASIVGVNCHFDPATSLQTVKLMKEGLEGARLKAYLMTQPLAYHTPDCSKQGFIDLPEFPFGKTAIFINCLNIFAWEIPNEFI